ncbi:YARHG domain-containing protein [Reichenbachiella ulvae]|uniref:YARHG domain-containing protein n=1 Tax=Reichenbachiella ulvae TaxID=2980104 RepID=A0ABT3CZ01_9BACT|nr:YARHG domain-containing protein [Reichenbachiella ulvae]MCV9388438.1 YARHG domain-containing protein [Reichenbachiella ulvae]
MINKLIYLAVLVLIISCGFEKKENNSIKTELIAIEDLNEKSLDDLRIIRNEIFARKGYRFKSDDLVKYFSGFDWYEPKYDNVDSLLSDLDKQNIQNIVELEKEKRRELERKEIKIDDAVLSQYESSELSADGWTKQFLAKMFQTIDQFEGRPADTTMFTIGNIDGIGNQDTIKTHIQAVDNDIFVSSTWSRKGEIIWSNSQKNPYLGINSDDIFSYEGRHPWVTFTIALNYSSPELSSRNDYAGIDRETAIKMAEWYIERKNLNISMVEYTSYFDSFDGQLILFGEPEIRHELMQWYEPKKQFILYYAP